MSAEAEVKQLAEHLRQVDERKRERERAMDAGVREAFAVLGPLIKDLPETDTYLLAPEAVDAWRVLRDQDPETYLVYLSAVRVKCGNDVTLLISNRVGPPGAGGAGTGTRRPIELLSPAELLARPVKVDLIPGILPARGNAVLFGQTGTGKTFGVVYITLSLVRGVHCFGRKVKQAGAIYVAAEGTLRGRLEASAAHGGFKLDDLPIRIIEQPIRLRGPAADTSQLIERVKAAADELGSVALVVIDTFNRTFAGGNENASEDVGEYLDNIGAIGDALGCLCLVVHHSGKDTTAGARGHSSLKGNLDAELEVVKDDATGIRTLTVTKMRDGPDGDAFSFRLEAVDLGPHPDPEADEGAHWGSCVVIPCDAVAEPQRRKKISASAQVALDALKAALDANGEVLPETSVLPRVRAVKVDKWQDAFARIRPIPQGLAADETKRERNARRMAFRRAQDELQAGRIAGTEAGFWWLTVVRT